MSRDTTDLLAPARSTVLLPRVNLMPPEIAERVTFRKIQYGLGAGVLVAVALVGLVYVGAAGSVSQANGDLDNATAQNRSLQSQTAKYNDVTAVYAQAAAANAQLTTAMGDEVRYSQLLSDLSMSVPSNVWLKNLSYTQTPPATAGVPAAPAAGASAPASGAPIGTFTVTGVGSTHDDVALWLESIAALKTYQDPFFSSSAEALIGNTHRSVTFTSTATVVSSALSLRYTKAGS